MRGEKSRGDPQTTDGIEGISQSLGHSLASPSLSGRNSGVTYALGWLLLISLTTSLPNSISTQRHIPPNLGLPTTAL